MKFWSRKTERDAVIALLEDETYEDAPSLADAVLKAAFSALLERDWWITVIGHNDRPAVWGYGLTTTQGEAEKLAVLGPARVINITSARQLLAAREEES